MNSNTHNNRYNNLYFYSPATLTPTFVIIQPINSLQNPTTEHFERLIRQYQQYFFHFIEHQDIILDLELKNFPFTSNLILNIEPSHHTMWENVTTIVLITTYTFCVLFIVCVLLEKILTTIKDNI